MNFELIQVLYNIGSDSVTLVFKNPLGGLTNVETTQAELNAQLADKSANWGDDETRMVGQAKLAERFPDLTNVAASLYVPEKLTAVDATAGSTLSSKGG